MHPLEFYQKHLDRVSRSFAFCIARLDNPFRIWVSLTYLVCRILDTVEDAPWTPVSRQREQFQRFDHLLKSPLAVQELGAWEGEFPEGITQGERDLLQDTSAIFVDLHTFPAQVRQTIQNMVGSMSAGMQRFAELKSSGRLHLSNLQEVNQYCFFVAGVVGEALTQLLSLATNGGRVPSLLDSHHFGLFLQKVNLLKDQKSDEAVGRFLIPSREEVFLSLSHHAEATYRYIRELPLEQENYRRFCTLSYFLGLASLPYIQDSYSRGKATKIPRWKAMQLKHRVDRLVQKPEALDRYHAELFEKSQLKVMTKVREKVTGKVTARDQDPETSSQEFSWFEKLYQPSLGVPLAHEHLQDLGIIA